MSVMAPPEDPTQIAAPAAPTPARPSGRGSALGDWLLLLVPGLIWGASFLFIAEGLEAVGPNGVTFTRILVAFATLSLIPAARAAVRRSDWTGIAWLGVLWFAFPLSMFPFAEQRVSSALTGMLNGATPLFTAIFASLLARRLPSPGVAAGLAVGMTGTVLVALPSLGEGRSSIDGVLLILAALVSYGISLNLARPLQQRNGALAVIWRSLGVGMLLTAPLGLPELLAVRWKPVPLLCLLALGALGTAIAPVLVAIAAGRLGSTRASATTFLMPPVALALGVALRHEKVALLSVLGGAICVAGAWLIRRAQTPSPRLLD